MREPKRRGGSPAEGRQAVRSESLEKQSAHGTVVAVGGLM
jgi:hypothetical protein